MLGEGNGNALQYSCWKIPWTEEPGRLQSMGSPRVGHPFGLDPDTLGGFKKSKPWGGREEKDTVGRVRNEIKGRAILHKVLRGSLVCYSPWGHKESDSTE